MKYIIDLPEEVYNTISGWDNKTLNWAEMILKNATPLPKGHRFIDADEILNHAFIRDDEEGDIFVQKYYCIKKEIMDNALVLFDTLEVDKEQEDGKIIDDENKMELIKSAKDISYIGKSFCDGFKEGLKEQEDEP